MKINIQAGLISAFLFIFYISSFFSLKIEYQDSAAIIKYAAIVGVAAILFTVPKKIYTDIVAFSGLIFFCLMTTIFTLINLEGANDVVVISGYIACLLIFYFSSKNSQKIASSTKKSLIITGLVFLVVNAFYVFNPIAYSIQKNQFTGFLSNANALAGLVGLFGIIFFAEIDLVQEKKLKVLFSVAFGLCGFFLFIAGSRAAILSVLLVVFYLILISKGKNKFLLFCLISTLICIILYIAASVTQFSGSNRELLEETGRYEIYKNYAEKFSETYFLLGTGISKGAGRLKSELSYLDVLLFSGIGSIGFFIFLISSLGQALRLNDNRLRWASGSFIYIFFISFFEGYAANIASIPSLLFYLLPGIIYYNNKAGQRRSPKLS